MEETTAQGSKTADLPKKPEQRGNFLAEKSTYIADVLDRQSGLPTQPLQNLGRITLSNMPSIFNGWIGAIIVLIYGPVSYIGCRQEKNAAHFKASRNIANQLAIIQDMLDDLEAYRDFEAIPQILALVQIAHIVNVKCG